LSGVKASVNRRRSNTVHKILLYALALSAIFFSPQIFAQEPVATNNLKIISNPTAALTPVCDGEDKTGFDALIYATCYSERHKAVVVLVSGNAGNIKGQVIAEHITKEFEKIGIPSVAYLRQPDWDKVGVAYFLNGDYYGPYSGQDWKEGKKILVVHSAEAWHQ